MIEDERDVPCGCSCHYVPGVFHCVPCCNAPVYEEELPSESESPENFEARRRFCNE
jgi:hypothetical protein